MPNPDPVEAGRKGGRSRSAAKVAAARRNGFQKRAQAQEQPHELQPGCDCMKPVPQAAQEQTA